jgi:hypothetical protein
MARAKEVPIPNTPARAQAALDADLPVVLRGRSLETAGWERPEPLTLFVPFIAAREDGTRDDYLLRLYFLYYPDWPPSAQFVNPKSRCYGHPEDLLWLPKIEGAGEIAVHAQYDMPGGTGKIQLICASVTLEFYQVLHDVPERMVWDPKVQNFAATIAAIDHGLRQPFYKGRQA